MSEVDNTVDDKEETTEERRTRLMRSRSGFKANLTRNRNIIRSSIQAGKSREEVRELSRVLQDAWSNFKDAHSRVHDLMTDEDDIEKAYVYFEEEETKMEQVRTKIESYLSSGPPEEEITPYDSASQVGAWADKTRPRSVEVEAALKKAQLEELALAKNELALSKRKLDLEQQQLRLEELQLQHERREMELRGSPSQGMGFGPEGYSNGIVPDTQGHGQYEDDDQKSTTSSQAKDMFLEYQKQQTQFLRELSQKNNDMAALTLPQPTVPTFNGNPLDYFMFISAFENLIERKTHDSSSRLYYLVQYCQGDVQELVKGCLARPSDEGYREARQLLERTYGQPYKIATAFADRATNGPPIKSDDPNALQKLAILLASCKNTLDRVGYLSKVENPDCLRKIIMRLPYDMRKRWRSRADDITERQSRDVNFTDIANFVQNEARTANHPMFGDILDKPNERNKNKYSDDKKASFATGKTQENKQENTHRVRICLFCERPHDLEKCFKFKEKSYDDRMAFARAKRICFNCLKVADHVAQKCDQPSACEQCYKHHATLLHSDNFLNLPHTSATSAFANSPPVSKICLPIVPVKVRVCNSNKMISTYALLDNGSNTSFCTNSLMNRLGLTGKTVKYSLATVERDSSRRESRVVNIQASNFNEDFPVELTNVYSTPSLPLSSRDIPTQEDVNSWAHLDGIRIMSIKSEVDLLIGNDNSELLEPLEVRISKDSGPFAVRTRLGWTINGPLDRQGGGARVSCFAKADTILEEQFASFCNREFNDCGANETLEDMSQLDRKALSIMQTTSRVVDNHYVLDLPFKTNPPSFPNNRILAEQRLKGLKRRLGKDAALCQEYKVFVDNLLEKNYAEKVPTGQLERDDGQVWYVPHHPVWHPQKNKLRVVFDCSAIYRNTSLNEQLLQGPNMTSTLIGVLLRFRQSYVAIMSDIESMFHRVRVTPHQCDALRFLWWPGGNVNYQPEEYRMLVHLFGAASSPSCCSFALRQTAIDNAERFDPDVVQVVRSNFYVDDCLKSIETTDDAIRIVGQLVQLLQLGGFRLTKWASNSAEVLKEIPEADRAKAVKDLTFETLPVERALGVLWDMHTDTLGFRVALPDRPTTRRGILSTMSAIYDPLGFVCPVVLPVRMLLQELCRRKLSWDDALPDEFQRQWETWKGSIPLLSTLSINRCLKPRDYGEIVSTTLHHFSDASTTGYGAVSYLRLVNVNQQVHCAFLVGKSRVTPLREITIPRLELSAATVSIKLDQLIRKEMELPIQRSYFWTDSTSVIKYICNEDRRFHVFVANRIATIRNNSDPSQWRFVPGKENPADEASRGCTVHEFLQNHRWRTGAAFLWQPEDTWTTTNVTDHLSEDDPEVKNERPVNATTTSADQEPEAIDALISRNSSWMRLKRIVAWILRFKNKERTELLSVEELAEAERRLLSYTQRQYFPDEYKALARNEDETDDNDGTRARILRSSTVFRLNPIFKDGLLRVGGRLTRSTLSYDAKHQILLPKQGNVTEIITRHYHVASVHSGREHTLSLIREKFWIVHANSAVRRTIHQCTHCRKRKATTGEQQMADLPPDRVDIDSPPFTNVGVDYFGPFLVKRGRSNVKRYGCIFTCLTTRAVHLEAAQSLETYSFINALRRFIARRGTVAIVRSDNGTNLTSGEKELRTSITEWNQGQIHSYLLQRNIKWIFNTPTASHHGGAWERCIRSVRKILSSLLSQQPLDDEGLTTVLCEVESIMNARPLTTVSNDPHDFEALTPNHLLLLRASPPLPPGIFTQHDCYARRRWRKIQYIADLFWVRFKREYLPILQARQKWHYPKREFRSGDVVVLAETGCPRGVWRLGRVIATAKGRDGHVRSVTIKTKSATLARPITKCVLLVESTEPVQ